MQIMARTNNKFTLTDKAISALEPKTKIYLVWDDKLQGLTLAVLPTGKKVYRLNYYYQGKQKNPKIGDFGILNTAQARKIAITLLSKVARGEDVIEERRKKRKEAERDENIKLESFVKNKYGGWVLENRKGGKRTLRMLMLYFPDLMHLSMEDITLWHITKWQSKMRKKGLKPSTINRILTTLKAVLSKAVEWGVLTRSPLSGVKNLKEEDDLRVRYLSRSEEHRVRMAFRDRQRQGIARRRRFNEWRVYRGKSPLDDRLDAYIDYLEVLFLVAINTGMRRGELFALDWDQVNFDQKILTVSATGAKSGKTRHIPLNGEAYKALITWRRQSKGQGLVFPSPRTGRRMTDVSKSWTAVLKSANISDFRFHDLRHTFASKLVMAGVDLNTVRELLGHADLGMTLRYAHLAPEHKAAAVALISSN